MYSQGNYAQFGQQLPPPPPPPRPPFQQIPPAPQHSIVQQGPPFIPSGQPGPLVYAHASSAPLQIGPAVSVPPGGMLSSGQSYMIPPPPPPPQVHRSNPMPHSYSTTQQDSKWTQNAHHISPQVPSPPGHPLPPRMPPPPPQGQPLYRGQVHQLLPGGVQGLQQAPPLPPPPPTSSYFTPAPFGSFIRSANESSKYNLPPPPPPPPPPSSPPPGPPPLPPSSPPPDSPLHPSSAPLFVAGDLSSSSDKHDDALRHNDNLNCEGGMGSEVSSLVIPSEGNLMSDLPPPPHKPAEERIVRKIEVLCQYIAKNGCEFEDMTRQKEVGNPEFGFLFGGEPGSEAAVAHEYFEWMKKKCSLGCELLEGRHPSDSSLRPLGYGSSLQPDGAMDAGISHSPADSDMDMEDDITQTDEPGMCNHESVVISNELDMTKQQHACDAEHVSAKDAIFDTLFCSGSSVLVEEGANLFLDGIQFDRSLIVSECPLDSKAEKCNISPHEPLSELNASAAAGISSIKVPSELIKGASPFRLLQDYASDDSSENDNEPCLEDDSPAAVSPSIKSGATSSNDFRTDLGSTDLSEKGFGPLSESVVTCSLNTTSNSPERSLVLQGIEKKTDKPIAIGKAEQLDNSFVDSGTSHKALEQRDDLEANGIDVGPESGKFQKEETTYISTQLKVDEFGRLAKAGASESDSDDLQYTRRRGKRGRSWSRSQSSHERRRRRSPWRRREKCSRSRSRSPKKRRSRSKSPSYRRGGESGGDRTRRDRAQLPVCYDFLQGKCFCGASCRYFHESGKNEESRQYKSKQHYQEVQDRLKSTDRSVHEHDDEVNSQEMELYQNVHVSSGSATRIGDIYQEEIIVSPRTSEQPVCSEKDGEPLITDVAEHNMAQGVTSEVQETQDITEEIVEPTNHLAETASALDTGKSVQLGSSSALLVTDADGTNLLVDRPSMPSSSENMGDQQSQANLSDPLLQNSEYQTQQSKGNSASDPAHAPESAIPTQLSICEPHENQISLSQSYTETDHVGPAYSSSLHIPGHPSYSQLPLPSLSQVTHVPFPSQLPREYNVMPPTEKYPSHSASMETYPPYQAPLPYQHSHFPVPTASSWNPLPPPPPRPPYSVPLLQFQQSQMPPRNDYPSQTFVRPYAVELPTHQQAGEFHQGAYPPVQQPDRPVSHTEDFRPSMFPVSYPMAQQFGGSRLVGEDDFGVPGKGIVSSISYAQGNSHPQPMGFSRESPAGRMQSFSGENLPTGGLPIPSSEGHPYLLPYSLQRPAADSISINLGEAGKMNSRRASDFLDRNQPFGLSNFGGSRILNHYNPYASTFDQPLSTKFSSNVSNQEKEISYSNKYGASFSLSHIPVDGQGVGGLTSMNMTSPNSARDFVRSLPRSGGDQYDPIFDSIEPSSSSFRKSDMDKKREGTDNSDIMLRVSGSNKPLDLEENSKHKEAGAVAASTSVENDEFGETADAEVGAVENGSPSSPIDLPNLTTGDIEIDQVKNPGKSKKNKDSRSMKLFKVSLANFVKDVLKPSWRQGNMSKEAFKTIVKKTVDKVSGAMKNHQVPKSQAKIDQYIDSSQRKLTKLVMGYVDKYVKV